MNAYGHHTATIHRSASLTLLAIAATLVSSHAAAQTSFTISSNQSTSGDSSVLQFPEQSGTVSLNVTATFGPNNTCQSFSMSLESVGRGAEAGSDFESLDTSLEFIFDPDIRTETQTVPFTLIDDVDVEGAESLEILILSVGVPIGGANCEVTGPGLLLVEITDNDIPPPASVIDFVGSPSLEVRENVGTIAVSLSRSGSSGGAVSATVEVDPQRGSADSGTDFSFDTTTVTWGDDDVEDKTVTVAIIDDTANEDGEDLVLVIGDVSGDAQAGSNNEFTITIVEAVGGDAPSFINFSGSPDREVTEADETITLDVVRSIGSVGDITATIEAVAGTAESGSDFSFQTTTLTWADGDTTPRTVTVTINNDDVPEDAETFDVRVSEVTDPAAFGENGVITFTINDDIDQDLGPNVDLGDDVRLSGSPGDTVETSFTVSDATFPVLLSAVSGTVAPARLDSPGEVTYTYAIPGSTETGITIEDTVSAIDSEQSTDEKTIFIDVENDDRDISDIPDLDRNQKVTAEYLDDLCPRLAPSTAKEEDLKSICDGIRNENTTDDQVRNALDEINPEEITVAGTSAVRLTTVQHGNLSQRLNALRSGASGVDISGINLQLGDKTLSADVIGDIIGEWLGGGASADEFSRWGFFANGDIRFGDKDSTRDEQGFDFDVLGITVGADYRFTPNLIVGGGIGYLYSEADFDSGSETSVDTWNGMLFGTWYLNDKYFVDAMFTYGSSDYDFDRKIRFTDALQTIDRTAHGDTDGTAISGGLSAGADWTRGGLVFGPHAGAYYVDVEVDSFRENGAGGLNLIVGDQNAQSFTVNAGLHVSYNVNVSWGVLVPYARLDTVHEFQDDREFTSFGFISDPLRDDPTNPTPSLSMRTDEADSHFISLSLGASAQFIHGVSGFFNFQRTESLDEWTVNQVNFGLRFEQSF